jgi:hypothetical protein
MLTRGKRPIVRRIALVLTASDIKEGQWNAAIVDPIAGVGVERQVERCGARYRATTGAEGSP